MELTYIKFLELYYNSFKDNLSQVNFNHNYDLSFFNKPFKHFDLCSHYSLIVSSEHRLKGCLNNYAIFNLININTYINDRNLNNSYSSNLTFRCVYYNSDCGLSSYLFNVTINNLKKEHLFINNISLNSNGTALILSSNDCVYIVDTPDTVTEFDVFNSDLDSVVITNRKFEAHRILKNSSESGYYFVKVKWNDLFSNSFTLLCINNKFNNRNGPYNGSYTKDFNDNISSIIMVFDIDKSLDDPIFKFTVSERMCRIGSDDNSLSNHKFQLTSGVLVDFFWNLYDYSNFGSFTLFALSNYGYLFCYCPIIISQYNHENKNLGLIKGCFDLMKRGFLLNYNGFKTNSNEYLNFKSNSDEFDLMLVEDLNKVFFEGSKSTPLQPIVVRLDSGENLPDSNIKYAYPYFDSFSVIKSDPLVISVYQKGGNLMLFQTDVQLYPSTEEFNNPKLQNVIYYTKSSQTLSFQPNTHYEFQHISSSDLLFYSTTEVYNIRYNNLYLESNLLYNSSDVTTMFYSIPVIYKSQYILMDHTLSQNPFSILLSQRFTFDASNKSTYHSMMIYKLVHRKDTNDTEELQIPDDVSCTEFGDARRRVPLIRPNVEIFDHIKKSKKEVNSYNDLFKTMKMLNESKDLNDKALDIVKTLYRLNTEVLDNLESRPLFEDALNDYLKRNEESTSIIDSHFNETIEQYHSMFDNMKRRVESINKTNQVIYLRQKELMKMLQLLISVKQMDSSLVYVTNMITEFYIRFSKIIVEKVSEKINQNDYEATYESKRQLMIDEWFHDTFKENVDLMHKIFNRIKTIRTAIDTMY